jgi:hypothetical protein
MAKPPPTTPVAKILADLLGIFGVDVPRTTGVGYRKEIPPSWQVRLNTPKDDPRQAQWQAEWEALPDQERYHHFIDWTEVRNDPELGIHQVACSVQVRWTPQENFIGG